jgi:hypothetical protein
MKWHELARGTFTGGRLDDIADAQLAEPILTMLISAEPLTPGL